VLAGIDLDGPGLELVLEVALVGEHAAGLEVRLRVALPSLNDTLGLRVAGSAEVPADLQLATERGELLAGADVVGVDAGLAIPNQRVG
jgi:hypothetical protein